MRKSIRILALLSVTALQGVHADGVNISGYLDIGAYRDFDKTSKIGTIQRSSLTFSGSEDLGAGNKVTFRLESRFEMGSGASEGPGKPFFHGESTVGLAGSWGALRLGRALTALWSQDWQFDPWYNFNRISSPAWQFWHYLTPTDRTSNNGDPEYGRLNNGIFYDSPNFNGFTVHLSGTAERTTAPGNSRGRSASLVYAKNGWAAMAAIERNGSRDKVRFLAGKGTFGNLTVMAAYDVSEMANTGLKANAKTLGATYVMGSNSVKAGFGRQNFGDKSTNFYSTGFEHNLSKRTMVYFSAGHFKPNSGTSSTAYGVGLAHSF